MHLKLFAAFVVIFGVAAAQDAVEDDIYVSNVDSKCLQCLCEAASLCTLDIGCPYGFCGPFQLSFEYYLDAVQNTAMEKTKEAFKTCAQEYECAERVVKYYVLKFAKDCNGDGVTDCTDYAMINFNGGYGCEKSLFREAVGRDYAGRFLNCTSY